MGYCHLINHTVVIHEPIMGNVSIRPVCNKCTPVLQQEDREIKNHEECQYALEFIKLTN